MPTIIDVKQLSKKYSRNAHAHLGYGLTDLFDELFNRTRNLELRKDEFWAIRNVSFSLEPGDTFGLVGRNGAGKSTLLKAMHGLTKPDTGEVRVCGRVQALINLQAGFNPNLSGRDNILNAASLTGLRRQQGLEIMDEVIEFAELDQFIDSPVRTYSSGMKARLGFGVAVHMQPDVLLIDEVLAVGDFAFQNKCYMRMQQLKKQGVTIVLVSHSHAKILQLCERALWLDRGKVMQAGKASEVVQSYLDFLEREQQKGLTKEDAPESPGKPKRKVPKDSGLYGPVYDSMERIAEVECGLFVDGEEVDAVPVHSELTVRFSFRLLDEIEDLHATLNFFRKDGLLVSAIATMKGGELRHVHHGRVVCEVRIADFSFCPGTYVIMLPICEGRSYLYRDVVKEFFVSSGGEVFWGVTDMTYTYYVENRE
jgi:ABC-type polysaccharide/polyol phosphate transport system ATPase subunit